MQHRLILRHMGAIRRKRDATFGGRLKLLREDADLTQDQLVAVLGTRYDVHIGRSYISNIERSDQMPNGDVIAGLARVLGTTADYLLGLTDVPDQPVPEPVAVGISPEAEAAAAMIDAMPEACRGIALEVVRAVDMRCRPTANAPDEPPIVPGTGAAWMKKYSGTGEVRQG